MRPTEMIVLTLCLAVVLIGFKLITPLDVASLYDDVAPKYMNAQR